MRARICLLLALLGCGALPAAAAEPAATPALLAQGQQVFVHRCGMCHREGGTGTFILARRLGAGKALLEKRDDLPPLYIRTVVRWGLVNMPRISRVELPNADMDAVVAYLTAAKGPATP
jgi:mono/diheme cytochrome c family protein